MDKLFVKGFIRFQFLINNRKRASQKIRLLLEEYLVLMQSLAPTKADQPVVVPAMRGVDEDMRNWSANMILEHNAIVNHTFTTIIKGLIKGKTPAWLNTFDPKKDVMPSFVSETEQRERFQKTVADHLEFIETLGELRGTPVRRHPIFGKLDVHGWHCMFALHLKIHLPQLQHVVSKLDVQM